MSEFDPLGIFLVSSGSRGDKLLFRYPYDQDENESFLPLRENLLKNPYAFIGEDICMDRECTSLNSNGEDGKLVRYTDKILGDLLAVKGDICRQRFEVKIDDIVFVGYPMHSDSTSNSDQCSKKGMFAKTSFNVVFALMSSADEYLISCYQDIAKQLAVALRHEDRRCAYLEKQKNAMISIQDEMAAQPEDSISSPYGVMLKSCALAKELKAVFQDLTSCGIVKLYINKWIQLNVCLPHKVHNLHLPGDTNISVQPQAVKRCLASLRPFHAILLLLGEDQLLSCLPIDSSPALMRIIHIASPLKSLQNLSSDADLPLGQVFQLVTHLVYWGKATIIYPLCETNTYVLAPNTNTCISSSMTEDFSQQFPSLVLHAVLADFSLPSSLLDHRKVASSPHQQAQEVQVVVWLLKHCLLLQLHTYIFLKPCNKELSSTTSGGSLPDKRQKLTTAKHRLSPSSFEDLPMFKAPSVSDMTSDGSPTQSGFGTFSAKSLSVDMSEDLRGHWLGNLTNEQKEAVLYVPAANNPEDLRLFTRLCPYFTGTHHLEEIMYYENVKRSNLLILLDKFRSVLVTCEHQDPGTACWTM